MYLSEVKAAGKDPARARVIGGDLWLIISEDPDRTFAECAPNLLYWFNAYSRWFEGQRYEPVAPSQYKEQILSLGLATIVTPEDAIKHIKARTAEVPVELFTMMLMPPGLYDHIRADKPRALREKGDAPLSVVFVEAFLNTSERGSLRGCPERVSLGGVTAPSDLHRQGDGNARRAFRRPHDSRHRLWLGDLPAAHEHFLYRVTCAAPDRISDNDRRRRSAAGRTRGSRLLAHDAWALWLLGYPEQARRAN